MDFLLAEIAEKKKKLRGTKRKADDDDDDREEMGAKKKYRRRGEIEQEEEERKEQEERERRAREKQSLDDSTHVDNNDSTEDNKTTEEEDFMDSLEVTRRLRTYRQPIKLFGESDRDTFKRLKEYEVEQHDRETGAMGEAALLQALQAEVEEDLKKATADSIGGDTATQREKEREKRRLQRRAEKYKRPRGRDEFDHDEGYCIYFIKRMLREWEQDLAARPNEIKRSAKGKHDAAIHKQTRQNLGPLLKLFKNKTSPDDVRKGIKKIVDFCHEREYVKANEEYMLLAIGNAAWPMGVTMVGIHERAGRERIFAQSQAHVMNDETQRKYISSFKRVMTYCQTKYPNVPSKNVM